jgi:hypothetical protein
MIKLTKLISGYMPPESGPFECEYCHYFDGKHDCELVEGDIEPDGCCNLFTESGKAGKPEEELEDEHEQIELEDE